MALNKCNRCGNNHAIDVLVSLYDKINNEKKQIIKNEITNCLKQKFSFEIFYQANLFDIIEFDNKVLQQQLDNFQPPLENYRSFKVAFGGQDDLVFPHLNELLNLSFKFDMGIGESTIKKLKQINSYYKWLLGMEEFDYVEFDPNWITLYKTRFFYKQMSKSKKLYKYLKDYLKKTSNSKIESVFFKIGYN